MSTTWQRQPAERFKWERGHPDGHHCYFSPSDTGCPCACSGCRPDLPEAELAALSQRLDVLANALFVVAMMHLTVEGVAA